MTMTGGCLCGQITYAIEGAPIATAVCHCLNCQRQSGSAFSVVMIVPSGALIASGQLKTYLDAGDSGSEIQRRFCPYCGSPILSIMTDAPAVTIVKAGTLHDTGALAPQFHVWCASAQPWVTIDPQMPQFSGNPPPAAASAAGPFDLDHGEAAANAVRTCARPAG